MLGEYTRGPKDKPRHRYDEDREIGTPRPGDSYSIVRMREQQRGKDAALSQKGRDMHLADNAARLDRDRTALRAKQAQERHALRCEWRNRNSERAEVVAKIKSSRTFRQQVGSSFQDRDRSRGGSDRGR